ncbi:SDR family NAD(P)-dependent oxidoreductase, partial [Mucilaginibacter sp.]|uniref:SDR family NAD(P)-dependent oxidoreductase n=1 Tax=Mucilaginibacter sp. TaxID=1882438 RepID=UPI000CBDEFFC
MEIQKLKGQSAIITGADSGIGKGVALALANAGAKVSVNFVHNHERADEVVTDIKKHGGEAIAIKADVRREHEA